MDKCVLPCLNDLPKTGTDYTCPENQCRPSPTPAIEVLARDIGHQAIEIVFHSEYLLRRGLSFDDTRRRHPEEISRAAYKINSLVQQLFALGCYLSNNPSQ